MNNKEREELKAWISKLQTREGAESFKATMGVGDKEVEYEISLAERVLREEAEYSKLIQELQTGYMTSSRERKKQDMENYKKTLIARMS